MATSAKALGDDGGVLFLDRPQRDLVEVLRVRHAGLLVADRTDAPVQSWSVDGLLFALMKVPQARGSALEGELMAHLRTKLWRGGQYSKALAKLVFAATQLDLKTSIGKT